MHSFQKSTDTVIIDEFSRSTCRQRTVSNSGAAQASTSKESSTGACQKKLLGEQIGWTDDVMGRRYFCYSHLHYGAFLGSSEFVRLRSCSQKMQDTQF